MDRPLADRRWYWIDDGLLASALACIRAVWVWLLLHVWSLWIQPARGDMLAPWLVVILLAASTLSAQATRLDAPGARPEAGRATRPLRGPTAWWPLGVVVGGGLAGLVLALYSGLGQPWALWDPRWLAQVAAAPIEAVFTVLVAAWLWWWGLLAGRDRLYYDTFANNFALGIAALALALTLNSAAQVIPAGQAVLSALLFFALSLGTLAIASLQSARRSERRRSEQTIRLSRYWLGMVGAVIVALLVAGLLLAQLFTPGIVERLLSVFGYLWDVLTTVLLVLLFALTYPLFLLYEFLRSHLSLGRPPGENPPPLQPPNYVDQFKDVQQGSTALSPALLLGLRVFGVLLLLAVVVTAFILAYRRLRQYVEVDDEVEETRELILSADLLKEQLAGLFGRRRPATASPPPYVTLSGGDPPARVRRVYQALLQWGVEQGSPRPPGATPDEYALIVAQLQPACRESIDAITGAYLRARYGADPVSQSDVERAEQAWTRMRETVNGR